MGRALVTWSAALGAGVLAYALQARFRFLQMRDERVKTVFSLLSSMRTNGALILSSLKPVIVDVAGIEGMRHELKWTTLSEVMSYARDWEIQLPAELARVTELLHNWPDLVDEDGYRTESALRWGENLYAATSGVAADYRSLHSHHLGGAR